MPIKAWKPTFAKVRSLQHLKNKAARNICDKICSKSDESLDAWPLKLKKAEPIYPIAEELVTKYFEPEVVEPVDFYSQLPEVVRTKSIQPILPELWQPWMAREIMEHEVVKEHMDYLEAMERRDKVTEALIVLRSEAAELKMEHTMSLIADAGSAILDELWKKGDLGD
jgi:hypothetical protein